MPQLPLPLHCCRTSAKNPRPLGNQLEKLKCEFHLELLSSCGNLSSRVEMYTLCDVERVGWLIENVRHGTEPGFGGVAQNEKLVQHAWHRIDCFR